LTRATVIPKRVKNATLGASQPQFDAEKAIENALILSPDVPTIQLAERLAKDAMAFPDFIYGILYAFFFRSLNAARKKGVKAASEQYQLPGFEHLPLRIRGTRNREVDLLDATYKGVKEWIKHLNAQRRNDPRMKEAKALLEKMREASKRQRGITVRRALGLDAKGANA
jgi:hypothetical protein